MSWRRVSRLRSGRLRDPRRRTKGSAPKCAGCVKRFPYGVYYLVEGEVLLVLAVAHSRREPHYWADRLRTVDAPTEEEGP